VAIPQLLLGGRVEKEAGVARAWPFENVPEAGIDPRSSRTPEEFVAVAGDGVEAVVVRIGLHDAQLLLVDAAGAWTRWVYHTMDEATAAAEPLGIPIHTAEFPEELRVRMNTHRRTAEDFERGPYPEQGAVGPLIPYPENRPRQIPETRES
jgi:hypothetical protein